MNFYNEGNIRKFSENERVKAFLMWGRINSLKTVLTRNELREFVDEAGNNAITLALLGNGEGMIEMIDFLLSANVNINHSNNYGYRPIYFAVLKKSSQLINMLILNGANVCLSKSVLLKELEQIRIEQEVKELIRNKLTEC